MAEEGEGDQQQEALGLSLSMGWAAQEGQDRGEEISVEEKVSRALSQVGGWDQMRKWVGPVVGGDVWAGL